VPINGRALPWTQEEGQAEGPALDKIVEHKGGLVPDFMIQHEGFSRRKRKKTDPSRMYVPPPEVAAVATERRKVLRQQAADMCSPARQL
jgi:hypothetical protein